MKRFVTAIALTCALSVSAFAGDIPMTVTAPTPPPDEATIPGDVPSTDFTLPGDMPAVDLLLTVLGLVF